MSVSRVALLYGIECSRRIWDSLNQASRSRRKTGGGVFSFAASAAPVARWAGRGLGGAGGAMRGFLDGFLRIFSAVGAGAGAGVVSIGDGAGDLATRLTRRFFFRLNASVKPESEASDRLTAVSLPVEGGVGLAARLLFDRERDRLEGQGARVCEEAREEGADGAAEGVRVAEGVRLAEGVRVGEGARELDADGAAEGVVTVI
ncbi:hypothetical protein ACJJTC_012448 [Scirpophaga incertulas]